LLAIAFLLTCRAFGVPTAAGPVPARIVVVCDNDYPPYAFIGEGGKFQGVVPDQWEAWSRITGVEVDLRAMSWADCFRAIQDGKADVIDTLFETPDRRQIFDFAPAYATIEVPVFIHKTISGIHSPADLTGFRIAVKEGDAAAERLSEAGVSSISLYPGYKDIIDAAATLETRIFCVDKPPALYYLYRYGIDKDFRIAFTLNEGAFHRAVLKGRGDLLAFVETGFKAIPQSTLAAIDRKWLGSPIASSLDLRRLAFMGAGLALAFLALLAMAAVLRKRVQVATKALREKVEALESSEARLTAFIAALPDLFFVLDREGVYREVYTSTPELLAAPGEEIIGKNAEEIIHDEALVKTLRERLAESIDGRKMTVLDYGLTVPGGHRFFEGRIVPLGRDSALLVSRDVTEQRAQEERLRSSLAEKEVLLKEVHHRVKNNMQVISSLIALQSGSYRDDKDRELIAETQSRIRAMARLHELLYSSPSFDAIEAKDYLEALVSELTATYGSRAIAFGCEGSSLLSLDAAVPFGLVANELITNALKYAHPDMTGKAVRVVLRTDEGELFLGVDDEGPGLPPDLDPTTSKTMGFLLVNSLAAQLGGRLSFSGPPGLRVELRFPRQGRQS
jgi:PAS domain S-box-containing protein